MLQELTRKQRQTLSVGDINIYILRVYGGTYIMPGITYLEVLTKMLTRLLYVVNKSLSILGGRIIYTIRGNQDQTCLLVKIL